MQESNTHENECFGAIHSENYSAAPSLRMMDQERIHTYLSSLDREIIFYIANVDKCTPRELMIFTGKSRPTILNHIKALIEKKMIEEHSASPKDPTKHYTIK